MLREASVVYFSGRSRCRTKPIAPLAKRIVATTIANFSGLHDYPFGRNRAPYARVKPGRPRRPAVLGSSFRVVLASDADGWQRERTARTGPRRLSSGACVLRASRTTRTGLADPPRLKLCPGSSCFSRPILCAFARPPCGVQIKACSSHCFKAHEQLALKGRTLAAGSKCGAGDVHTVRACNRPEVASHRRLRPHDFRVDHRRHLDHRPWPDSTYPGMDQTQRDAAALNDG